MNISKAERKYRIKFIQEHHYNKSEQRIFDEFAMRMSITYKEVYKSMRSGMVFSFMATIVVARASKAIRRASISIAQLGTSLQNITKIIKEYEEEQNEARKKSYRTAEEIS